MVYMSVGRLITLEQSAGAHRGRDKVWGHHEKAMQSMRDSKRTITGALPWYK